MPLVEDAPHSDITYKIIGSALAVHHRIGPGHKERVYQHMLTDEMVARGLCVEPERAVQIAVDEKVYGLLCLDHLVSGRWSWNARPYRICSRRRRLPK